ncbi:MAG: FKBP-type peptidyl-prolyl cis-trans isomerase [Xanthomonadales bacterium]|nr:Outer membrane protein MIP [Xanthomonadales bacterium]MCC6592666.1 FKBP-type peptidyl-prolyl cis-trans isomerase [Xanthomonadales bacterium]
MKITGLAALAAAMLSLSAFAQTPASSAAPATTAPAATIDRTKMSYAVGYQFGADLKERGVEIDLEGVIRALRDGFAGKEVAYPREELGAQMELLENKLRTEAEAKFRKLAADNKAASDKFMAENRAKKGIVALPSGIQYRVIEEGNGARPTATSEVTVHYRGSLTNGFEFDSSFARGVPAKFQVDQVLKGWQEVLPLMRVGDHWQIFLPPDLAYGERGPRPIGPNSALIFDIKLIEVK